MPRTGRPRKTYDNSADQLHAAHAADRRAILVARRNIQKTTEWIEANDIEKKAILERVKEKVIQDRESHGIGATLLEQEIAAVESEKKIAKHQENAVYVQEQLEIAKSKQEDPKTLKGEIASMYEAHWVPMIKHLEHQIFHAKAKNMTAQEQSDFLQNVLDPEEIQDQTKAYLPIYQETDTDSENREMDDDNASANDMDIDKAEVTETRDKESDMNNNGDVDNIIKARNDVEEWSEWEGFSD